MERKDYTQTLFSKFMLNAMNKPYFGYYCKDAVVLTTDISLFRKLSMAEKSNTEYSCFLPLSELGINLSTNTELTGQVRHSMLISQLENDSSSKVTGETYIYATEDYGYRRFSELAPLVLEYYTFEKENVPLLIKMSKENQPSFVTLYNTNQPLEVNNEILCQSIGSYVPTKGLSSTYIEFDNGREQLSINDIEVPISEEDMDTQISIYDMDHTSHK